jgi:hypothetical protein
MLKITIEYLPLGGRFGARNIAEATIRNDATGNPASGNYDIEFRNLGDGSGTGLDMAALVRRTRNRTRRVRIENWPRKERDAWELLAEALRLAYPERERERDRERVAP